jgi:FAD/FMN-containing dehydrogenase
MPDAAAHRQRLQALREQLARLQAQREQLARAQGDGGAPLGLAKSRSNLFRDRDEPAKQRLDLRGFDHVIGVDPRQGWVDVEGLATFETLVDATLRHGVMPAVVPQLKTITAAGAVAGVGIEATSFRHGLVHDTLLDLDVLLPDGSIVHASPDNAHRELFFGFANSYGTLGYALRLRLRTVPAKPLVRVRHADAAAFLDAMSRAVAGDADFVDGVVFRPDLLVLSVARFADVGPPPSDYTFENVYYRSLLERTEDTLSTEGYLWRWDTDWFWNSRQFGLQHPLLRRLAGRRRLNSRTYTRWMRWNARLGLTRRWATWRGRQRESVIQDVDIPWPRAAEFLAFLHREIGILPVWVCPIRAADPARRFPLYPLTSGVPHVNFGFWDVVESQRPVEPGHFNRLVEQRVSEMGGIKSLYSDSFFTREAFDQAYGGADYAALKARYDPQRRLLDLYDKCVLRR